MRRERGGIEGGKKGVGGEGQEIGRKRYELKSF